MGLFVVLLTISMILNCMLSSHADLTSSCPSICSCKWKGGKPTAECIEKGLTSIPSDLHADTRVIDLRRNNFGNIKSHAFQKEGLVNLQKIFLMDSGITDVAPDAFFQLSNLVELHFSGNKLTSIPTDSLRDCPLLRRLHLSKNPIKFVPDFAFSSPAHPLSLTILDLSNCEIESVQPKAFSGLESLQSLELNGNRLHTLSINVLKSLELLTSLHLNNNPWNCDCRIRDIRIWMADQKIPLSVPPNCFHPKQSQGMTWDIMSLDDFACPPSILTPSSNKLSVVLGQNASMECRVDSTPSSTIYWVAGGRTLVNTSVYPEYRGKYHVNIENSKIQSSRLTVTNMAESDSDVYTCYAENNAGNSSINFTVVVAPPYSLDGSWGTTQIIVVTVCSLLVIIIALLVIGVFVFHPSFFSTGTKVNGVATFIHLKKKNPESVEMNDVRTEKEEKEYKVIDKQPRHETGSSGYGSDQLTPDLVSKIVDTNHGTLSASTVTCNHPDMDLSSLNEGYGPMSENWLDGRPKPPRYDDSPERNVYSEIYPNPCFGKDDLESYSIPSPTILHHLEFHGERYIPQNDRVRTLRAGIEGAGSSLSTDESYGSSTGSWKRSPLATNITSYAVPTKARFSPDEGYAEEALEGTEV